jgi:hypothetical protein
MASLAWSISVGDSTGTGTAASGTLIAEALLTASGTVDAGASRDLTLQIGDVTRVGLLIVTASRYDGSVSVKGAGAQDPTLALTGPIMAFGDAAERLASSLETVTISAAAAPATPATVSFLLATRLT